MLFLQYLSYHTNLTKLDALGLLSKPNKGGATKDNNQNFARGSPTEIFFHLISLVDVVSVPVTGGENWTFESGFPAGIFLKLLLASLGNPTKTEKPKITTGTFQGVLPMSSFLYLFFFGSRGISSTN